MEGDAKLLPAPGSAAAGAEGPASGPASGAGAEPRLLGALAARLRAFLVKQFLPIGLVAALAVGMLLPAPGAAVSSVMAGQYRVFPTLCIFFIFLLSGLAIKTSEVRAALGAGRAVVYSLVSILALTPAAGFVSMSLGVRPREFMYGMAVFSCVPTTLTSGMARTSALLGMGTDVKKV